jgi:ribosomal protein L18
MTSQAIVQSNNDTMNILTSFSMPLKEKIIKNLNKKKSTKYIIGNEIGRDNFKGSVVQIGVEAKN